MNKLEIRDELLKMRPKLLKLQSGYFWMTMGEIALTFAMVLVWKSAGMNPLLAIALIVNILFATIGSVRLYQCHILIWKIDCELETLPSLEAK